MKRMIGMFLIAIPILVILAAQVTANGLLDTIITWIIACVFAVMVFGGVHLLDATQKRKL